MKRPGSDLIEEYELRSVKFARMEVREGIRHK